MVLNGFYHNTAAVTVHVSDNPDSRKKKKEIKKRYKINIEVS